MVTKWKMGRSQKKVGSKFRFYSDFIQILFRFYSHFIHILFRFYSHFIHILFTFYSDFIQILFRFIQIYSDFIQILFRFIQIYSDFILVLKKYKIYWRRTDFDCSIFRTSLFSQQPTFTKPILKYFSFSKNIFFTF